MKKVLAVLLSVMMLFGALSVGASAATTSVEDLWGDYDLKLQANQVILSFNLNSGSIKGGVKVYEPGHYILDANNQQVYVPGTFLYDDNYTESMYYMIPDNSIEGIYNQLPNSIVSLPSVNPPSGYIFNGWYCYDTNETYPANRGFQIPIDAGGKVLQFMADYSLAEPEEDTMAGVLNILVKVFGTIIGLLFYSGEYGSAATEVGMQIMEDLLGGLFS